MMVLPRPLPSRIRRRPGLLAGAIVALLCAGIALPAFADGGLVKPGAAAPRSRLYVEIPGYTAYYAAPEEPAGAVSPSAPRAQFRPGVRFRDPGRSRPHSRP